MRACVDEVGTHNQRLNGYSFKFVLHSSCVGIARWFNVTDPTMCAVVCPLNGTVPVAEVIWDKWDPYVIRADCCDRQGRYLENFDGFVCLNGALNAESWVLEWAKSDWLI
jgi:hypothetical protein